MERRFSNEGKFDGFGKVIKIHIYVESKHHNFFLCNMWLEFKKQK